MNTSPFGFSPPNQQQGFGSTLFKTMEGQAETPTQPMSGGFGGSPFAPSGAQPMLTVGDVLPLLPPDLVKMNALHPGQPIQLPAELIENALAGRSGIPVFEIYRVCPAMFLGPVSPQDGRTISLPGGRLPALVAGGGQGQGMGMHPNQAPAPMPQQMPQQAQQAAQPSPFASAQQDMPGGFPPMPGGSPFQNAASPQRTTLPPPRDSAPPPMPAGHAPSFPQAGGQMPGGSQQQSPFGAGTPFQFPAQPQAAPPAQPAIPFMEGSGFPQVKVGPPPMPQASPGGAPSPFQFPASAASGAGSPFGSAHAPQQAEPPPAQPAPASPFGQSGGPIPFALTEPAPPPAAPPMMPPAMPQQAPQAAHPQQAPHAPPAAAGSGPAKLSLATLIKGFSSSELGFEPAMVPTWITTSVSAAVLAQSPGAVTLGALIDGVTDIGFRNVLSSGRREVKIPLPANELFHALPSVGAPAAHQAAPPAQAMPPPQPPALQAAPPAHEHAFNPAAHAMPQPHAQTMMPPAQPMAFAPAQAGGFQPHGGHSPHPEGGNRPFGEMAPPQAPSFNPPPLAPPPLAPPSPPAEPSSAGKGPVQPLAGLSFAFPTAPSQPNAQPQPPAPPPPTIAEPAPAKPLAMPKPGGFDPFAAPAENSWGAPSPPAAKPAQEGLGSDQLFGAMPAAAPMFGERHGGQNPPPQPAAPPALPQSPAHGQATGFEPVPFQGLPGGGFGNGAAAQQHHSQPQQPRQEPPAPAFGGGFGPPPVAATPPAAPPAPTPPPAPEPPKFSFTPQAPEPQVATMGLTPAHQDTEQLMLRALLGVNEPVTPERVVELVARMPGVAACACVHGSRVVSHGAQTTEARDFQQRASDLARTIQGLIPLIGIEGAETFSLNTAERLITFAFHAPLAFGVLHESQEPAAGLRDKVTLISRELSRLWSKSGGRV